MKVEAARRLFDTDAESSFFSAEIGKVGERLTVCLYPRKKNPGFLYCIWKPGVSTIGTQAIIAGGTIKTESVQRAAVRATKALLSSAEVFASAIEQGGKREDAA